MAQLEADQTLSARLPGVGVATPDYTGHARVLKSAKIKASRSLWSEIRVYGEKRWSLIGRIREITGVSGDN